MIVEYLKRYSCRVLFKILSNPPKESNCQGCVRMELLLLSLILVGTEWVTDIFSCLGFVMLVIVPCSEFQYFIVLKR